MKIRSGEPTMSVESLSTPMQEEFGEVAGWRKSTVVIDISDGLRGIEAMVPGTAVRVADRLGRHTGTLAGKAKEYFRFPVIPISPQVVQRPVEAVAPTAARPQESAAADPRHLMAVGELGYALSDSGSVNNTHEAEVTARAGAGLSGNGHASIAAVPNYDHAESSARALRDYVDILGRPSPVQDFDSQYPATGQYPQVQRPDVPDVYMQPQATYGYDQAALIANSRANVDQAREE